MADKNDKIRQSRVFNTTFDDLYNAMTGQPASGDALPADIVVSETGDMTIGGYTLTAMGLVISGETTYEDWEKTGLLLLRLEGSIQMLIGDWLGQAERVWGRTYEEIAEKVGRNVRSLYQYKWVAENVQFYMRHINLTFSHYAVVARLPEGEKEAFLQQAAAEGWSVKQLRRAVYPPTLMETGIGEKPEIFQGFGEKSKGIVKLARTMRRAGQGDESARMEALGRIARYRAWLDELEGWLSDE